VRVSVADSGPGVPEEFRGRIFGKFAQADGSDTRGRGGTGLGLSISRAIVEKLGGTMDYQSTPGKGATFYFDLPLRGQG
jgi:signal transduction histidine kinase